MNTSSKQNNTIGLKELCSLKKQGVRILIDGLESDECDIFNMILLSEDAGYMGDFIDDPITGKLCEIHFDRIHYVI